MKLKRLRYQEDAVTPVISTILLMAITLTIIGGIMWWALPTLLDQEADAKFETAYNNLEVLATGMEDSVYAGEDSSRTIHFDLAGGDMNIRDREERWTVSYTFIDSSLNFTSYSPGSRVFAYDFHERASEPNVVHIRNLGNGTVHVYDATNDSILMDEELFRQPSHITIYNGTRTNLSHTLAEVWLFYIDAVTYRQPTGRGEYNIRLINGGIITDPNSDYGYIARQPMILAQDNSIIVYMVQMNATALTGGGAGKYRATMTVDDMVVRKVGDVKHLRFQIEGDKYRQGWYTYYFISELGCGEGYRSEDRVLRSVEFSPYGFGNTANLKLVQVYQDVRLEER